MSMEYVYYLLWRFFPSILDTRGSFSYNPWFSGDVSSGNDAEPKNMGKANFYPATSINTIDPYWLTKNTKLLQNFLWISE